MIRIANADNEDSMADGREVMNDDDLDRSDFLDVNAQDLPLFKGKSTPMLKQRHVDNSSKPELIDLTCKDSKLLGSMHRKSTVIINTLKPIRSKNMIFLSRSSNNTRTTRYFENNAGGQLAKLLKFNKSSIDFTTYLLSIKRKKAIDNLVSKMKIEYKAKACSDYEDHDKKIK